MTFLQSFLHGAKAFFTSKLYRPNDVVALFHPYAHQPRIDSVAVDPLASRSFYTTFPSHATKNQERDFEVASNLLILQISPRAMIRLCSS
mmetsp:Transcript_18082/g.41843  ORF Transcript_18082/g.41843 Transcript_18082/m.41843 type:complete len:90 (+) Transcript_18082:574-843(+)